MGHITTMRDLIGIVKDKLSLSKLTLLSTSKPHTLSLHLAVLRTTTHSPPTPPHPHHLSTLLSLGDSSRATANLLITSLLHRLHRTTNSTVALKSLLTLHHIIRQGPFILKDQLSVHPSASGGRSNLNLSNFHDGASPATWALSLWIRWYARYLETVLSASKSVGFSNSYSVLEREKQQDSISSFLNSDLIRDFCSLVGVVEEICEVPDNLLVEGDRMVAGVMELVASDYLSAVNELLLRLGEFKERVELLSFEDSVELGSGLDRLIRCKATSFRVFYNRKPSVDVLWEMVDELNNVIGMVHLRKVGRSGGSESARFVDRVLKTSDHMRFSSGRLRLN